MLNGNGGFGMIWLGSLAWLLGLVFLIGPIVLAWTAIVWLRRHAAGHDAPVGGRP